MKVLYVDISLLGHRLKYIEALLDLNANDKEISILIPNRIEGLSVQQFEMKSGFDKKRNLLKYYRFIQEVKEIVREQKIDIVHFLCGDALYRYFGLGLNFINAGIIVTFHHMVLKTWKTFSVKNILRQSYCGVVHTHKIEKELKTIGLINTCLIEYPMLDNISKKTSSEAKDLFGLPHECRVMSALGGTLRYKGLDILIDALNQIQGKCCLFIAGSLGDFNENYIRTNLTNPNVQLKLLLRRLTDEEMADAVQASDTIVLPYRREFDGASGMLIVGLFHNKHVIGANHGSMGNLIKKYDLGRMFQSENVQSLVEVIDQDLSVSYQLTKKANKFRENLSVDSFLNSHCMLYNNFLEE